MGKNCYCDLCGVGVATEKSLTEIRFGDVVEAEACFACNGAFSQDLRKRKAGIIQTLKSPPVVQEAAPAPEAAPVVPPAAPEAPAAPEVSDGGQTE